MSDENKNVLEEAMDAASSEVREYASKPGNIQKIVRQSISIYNRLCRKCQRLMQATPNRPLTDYCKNCQRLWK